MEIHAERAAKEILWAKLDENLLSHAKDLFAVDEPQIVDVYSLQGLAEVHCYLKTVHQFDPAEVEALLQFADPLAAAHLCWEENSHEYSFPICDLLRETEAKKRLPLAEPEPPKRQSVREQLHTAVKEARQQSTQEERPKGGDAR
ncbi:MAG: hypothetical protein K2O18_17175 [Oscillospiraceae bacterium]|nr:hypothetical protein [Oscillospiraceae bacterium]